MTKAQKLVIGVPLTAIILTTALALIATTQSDRAYQEDLKKLRAMGVVTNAKELTAKDTGDPETGEIYRDIANQIRANRLGGIVDSFSKWDKTTPKADLAGYRNKLQDLYPLIEGVSARPSISFERNWSENYALLLPEYADMKTIGKMMLAETRLRAAEGDIDGTIIGIQSLEGIAKHAGSEPAIIAGLVASSLKNYSFTAKAAALQAFSDDHEALERLRVICENPLPIASFKDQLAGEVAIGVEFFNSRMPMSVIGVNSGKKEPMDYVAELPPVRSAVKRKFVASWRATFESLPADEHDFKGYIDTMKAQSNKVDSDKSLTGRLNSVFFPVFEQATLARASIHTRDKLAQLGVLLVQDYNATGKYPGDLSSYHERAVDPFTGKPFIYKSRSDGFTLYSVGTDGVDDGGVKVGSRYKDIVLEISNKK
jgi:hypothetical protein